jgi:hypothetical protein
MTLSRVKAFFGLFVAAAVSIAATAIQINAFDLQPNF